jgi:hypothetical protein
VDEGAQFLIGLVIFVLGGVALMITAMNNRRRLLEIAHRERVAMIERGLLPTPELDPAGFESGSGLSPRRNTGRSGERYRTAGVLMIGTGLGLMVLLTFAAGVPEIGVGVGGAWAVLGGALLLNYFLVSRREIETLAGSWRPPTQSPKDAPSPPNDALR